MTRNEAIQVLHNLFFKANCQNCLELYKNGYECFNNYCPIAKEFNNAIESLLAEPSEDIVNKPNEYNLELIADIVRQLGHLDNYIADTYIRPNNKIHIQFENIFSDDYYFIEDDKYILAELEKIATDTKDCVEFTLTNNQKVIIHSADKPRGKWETNNTYEDLIFCSECGMSFEDNLLPRNYCPCCGADMRGERNE